LNEETRKAIVKAWEALYGTTPGTAARYPEVFEKAVEEAFKALTKVIRINQIKPLG
jgi:hypothetical protein